jgi:hypothetical protein
VGRELPVGTTGVRLANTLGERILSRVKRRERFFEVLVRCRKRHGTGVKTSMNLAGCIERGRERRVTLNCEAVVVEPDGCSTDVILIDMTQHGFRLRSENELEVGAEVLLQMPQVPAVRGMIHWMSGHEAGGVFLDPIMV